ncbi:MAG TPA: acid phosphatase [Burkholderiaceae bacterium]|nr:acid phosphatase [Burkholderiaceae bacterium]
MTPFRRLPQLTPICLSIILASCASFALAGDDHRGPGRDEDGHGSHGRDERLRAGIKNIVVIYAENRSFDNLFGHFPGASGLDEVLRKDGTPKRSFVPQVDRDGSVLPVLPPTWGGVTAAGVTPVVTQAQSANLPNAPFPVETAFTAASGVMLSTATVTRDLYHRFFENQMEINGGRNDSYAAWADAGGLTMGHFDYSNSDIYKLAREYTLADHFFQGAFGGSFLNHQYLICACAPQYPNADSPPTGAKPTITVLDKDANGAFLPKLTTAATSPASALDGPPVYVLSGNIAPLNYFGDGKFYAVNTMQPPYQPSGNTPVDATAGNLPYANPAANTTLPPQTTTNIGDQLSNAGVSWKWYAGAWDAAVADGTQPPSAKRTVIYASPGPGQGPNYQAHHAPFNYYARFDPLAHPADRQEHLQDLSNLLADAAAGTLPAVSFYKPEGDLNQHEGYANLDAGDAHIASLVAALQASPQWKNMLIVITYDEFGGVWDHVAPPHGDKLGPGTRIPAVIISPFAKRHHVEHTSYDTASVLRFITRRWDLDPLPGLVERDRALRRHGEEALGDLTEALDL